MSATPSLDAFLATLAPDVTLGVAVSGGSDSMALLQLLAHAPCMVCACTVHHHLRPEAGEEAAYVAQACAELNVSHETLHWHWDGQGNLQDQARRGRYAALARWAAEQGIGHVVLGHTADDNVETFLMGLSRGAGLDGLSGMRESFSRGDVRFHRPLLKHKREDLRDYLRTIGVAWREDPSNVDPEYQRIRMRQGLSALGEMGLTPDMILKTIENLNATRRDLDVGLAKAARGHLRLEHGDILIDLPWLAAATPEHRRRILASALRYVSSQDYPPRSLKLARLMEHLEEPAALHGCLLSPSKGVLRITREHEAVKDQVCRSREIWDKRWRLDGPHTAHTTVRALGEQGLAACPKDWRETGLPRSSLLSSPSVWDSDSLVSAPLAGWDNGWTLTPCTEPPDLIASILSH